MAVSDLQYQADELIHFFGKSISKIKSPKVEISSANTAPEE